MLFFFMLIFHLSFIFFFFNDTATTEIYTLSLHDALPIYPEAYDLYLLGRAFRARGSGDAYERAVQALRRSVALDPGHARSEEHTSELQSRPHLVCRLLLEKKKKDQVSISCSSSKVPNPPG